MTEVALLNEEPFTESEIKAFDEMYLAVMQDLSGLVKAKKELEQQEKDIKKKLEDVMDEYGIKSVDNQYIKIIRVAASEGKQTVDLDKLQKEEPDLYNDLLEDYPKITGARKASVRFEVK